MASRFKRVLRGPGLARLLVLFFALQSIVVAVPPPSLAGVVACVVGVADHPKLIAKGLKATGKVIARPFRKRKKP